MPRRSARQIGASSYPTEGHASTSSDPFRVPTNVGVARPPRRGVAATPSTGGRRRPTVSVRRRRLVHDPLSESPSEDDTSEDEAGPSSSPQPSRPPLVPAVEETSSQGQAQPSSPGAAAAGDGPIPGGPVDESVLVSVRTHVAISIWDGEVRVTSLYVLSNYFSNKVFHRL